MEHILSGKNILITGGTSALGQEFVKKALIARASVFFTYFSSEKKAKELISLGAKGFPLDLSETKNIDKFLIKLKEKISSLDVLIHNAALVLDERIETMSEEKWDKVLAVNLKAPYYLTKNTLNLLMGKKPSKIFMIISRAGISGSYGAANYASAKAGLIALTKSLAKEMGKKKILVNAVNPGFMESKMTKDIPKKIIQHNLELSPLKQFSSPKEVSDFLISLSSDQMKQVTGQVLHFESRSI